MLSAATYRVMSCAATYRVMPSAATYRVMPSAATYWVMPSAAIYRVMPSAATYLHGGEAQTDDEVGGPVDDDGHTHGGRSRTLREQLSRDHPRDGTYNNKHNYT